MKLPNLKSIYSMKPQAFSEAISSIKSIDYAKISSLQPTAYVGRVQENIAIIPVKGMLFAEDNLFCWLFGGSSISAIANQFAEALSNPEITGIIFDVNSPGGEVDGTPELAQMIYEARDIKPTVAYVSRMGCSAGYWIASACSKVVMHESAEAGCIGVCASYEVGGSENVVQIVSSISPNKIPDPTTDEGLSQLQSQVDKLGAIFLSNTAKYRGVEYDYAMANFGRGDVLMGNEAKAAGLADEVGTFKTAMATIYSYNNKGGVYNMQTEKTPVKAEMVDPSQITLDWLKQNRPDLVEEIKNDGMSEEQSRQNEIDDVEAVDIPEEEVKEMRKAAKAKKGFTAGEFAKQILMAQKSYREKQLAIRNAEAAAVPATSALQPDKDEERTRLLEAGKKAFSKVGR